MDLKQVIKAKNLDEVLELLKQHTDKAKLIAGGTDIVIDLKHGKISPEVLIDISDVNELRFIRESEGFVEIGAASTFTDMQNSPMLAKTFKGLADAAHSVGSPQIRNKGTVGGNISNGSPAADTVPPLLALSSVAVIKSAEGTREVDLDKFFFEKKKVDLKANEVLYSVKFKKAETSQGLGFGKLGLRKALAISRISVGVFLDIDNNKVCKQAGVASGSLGLHAIKEKEIESFLVGKTIDEKTIDAAADLYKDVVQNRLGGRSTAEFKREAVKGIFKEAINNALNVCK